MGREAVLETFASTSSGADIALIEGMMGLFDGASATSEEGSTAQIAKWLDAPVALVVDASGMARTLAAVVHGAATFDPELKLGAVLANRVGSRGHLDLLRQAVSHPPVLGGLPNEPAFAFPERHLGLITASEESVPDRLLNEWGRKVQEWFDIDALLEVARSAPVLFIPSLSAVSPAPVRCKIGYAYDAAFHFYYEDNLRRLRALGAELVPFSPINDSRLPEVDGLYFGGGYPEVHAVALAANASMKAEIALFAAAQKPIYAECGGLMYLSKGVRTLDGRVHEMAGLIHAIAILHDRLQALGYVEVETTAPTLLGPAGLRFRGHQFRYSELRFESEPQSRAYHLRSRLTGPVQHEGYRAGSVLASYVHAHWASNPAAAEGFVKSCSR